MGSVLLECSLDDVTGEQLAHAIGELLKNGALDAHALFGIGKKGRPLFVLRAVCSERDSAALSHLMARQTGTMGVKKIPFSHFDFEKNVTVSGGIGKKSTAFSSKFEFVPLRKKAQSLGLSPRELERKLRKKR